MRRTRSLRNRLAFLFFAVTAVALAVVIFVFLPQLETKIEDQKLGIQLARWAREQLAEFPLAVDYRELPMGHGITAESLAVVTSWLSGLLDAAASR